MFSEILTSTNIKDWCNKSKDKTLADVLAALNTKRFNIDHMSALLSDVAYDNLELLAKRSREIKIARFGKAIALYTPIYISSYCQNSCTYCGFRKGSNITRKIQTIDEVYSEAMFLKEQGFKNLLLVSGDDPNVTIDYLAEIINRMRKIIPSISLEIAPKTEDEYRKLYLAGADGIIIYQETYEKDAYTNFHLAGSKKDFKARLNIPETIAKSGISKLGIGALLGLSNFTFEGLSLFLHASYLIKNYWQTQVTISLPRLREAKGAILPPNPVSDRRLTQLICALKIALPDVGLLLSTRESAKLRDGLINIGITQISAGSKTEPGGYLKPDKDSEQFSVSDNRTSNEVAKRLVEMGYDPVWKDWEGTLNDML